MWVRQRLNHTPQKQEPDNGRLNIDNVVEDGRSKQFEIHMTLPRNGYIDTLTTAVLNGKLYSTFIEYL